MGASSQAFFGYGIIYGPDHRENFTNFRERITNEKDWSKAYEKSKDYPVGYSTIGCEEYPSYFIYIKSTLKISEWDEETAIGQEDLIMFPEWIDQLNQTLEKLNLPKKSPKFLMTSRYS